MPKILLDLPHRILETAVEHFKLHGYETTDMKKIATELGISVGTIYNNYLSKPKLFLAVMENWRREMEEELDGILGQTGTPLEKVQGLLQSLLKNSENFVGLWKEFSLAGGFQGLDRDFHNAEEASKAREDVFHSRLITLLGDFGKTGPAAEKLLNSPGARFTKMLIMTAFFLTVRFPGEHDDNWEYLRDLTVYLFDKESR